MTAVVVSRRDPQRPGRPPRGRARPVARARRRPRARPHRGRDPPQPPTVPPTASGCTGPAADLAAVVDAGRRRSRASPSRSGPSSTAPRCAPPCTAPSSPTSSTAPPPPSPGCCPSAPSPSPAPSASSSTPGGAPRRPVSSVPSTSTPTTRTSCARSPSTPRAAVGSSRCRCPAARPGPVRPRLRRPRRPVRREPRRARPPRRRCAGGRPPSVTSAPTSTWAGAPTTSAAASSSSPRPACAPRRGVAVATASSAARRRAARRVALARAPWWIAPAARAVDRRDLGRRRGRAAAAQATALRLAPSCPRSPRSTPSAAPAARWRTRHRREVGRRDLRALFEPRRAVLTGWGDAVHDALVSPRPPIGDDANDLNPRSWFVKVVRHPGVLAVTGALVVTVVAGRSLGTGVVTGLGSGLTGGEVVGTRASAGTLLWSAWTDGWTGGGLGGPDPVGPHAPLLALPAWLVDHLPLLPSPTSPAGLVVGLVVLLGMPLAATSAFVAFRTMVPSRRVRGLAAFAWATTGVAAASVAQGRLGAVVALVLLPFLASGLWLLATRRSTATSAFATALAAVVLGAFAPVLLAVVVRPRARPRRRPPRGPRPRAGRRRRPGRGAGALAGPRRRGLVAGARRRRGPGAVGRLDARAVAAGPARTPAVPAPRSSGPRCRSSSSACSRWPAAARGARRRRPSPCWRRSCSPPPSSHPRCAWAPCRPASTGPVTRSRCGPARCCCPSPWCSCCPWRAGSTASGSRAGPRPGACASAPGGRRPPPSVLAVRRPRPSASSGRGSGTLLAPWRDPRPAVSVQQAEGAFATRSLFVSPGNRGAGYRFVGREAADCPAPPARRGRRRRRGRRPGSAPPSVTHRPGRRSSPTPRPTSSPCAPASSPR